MIVIQNLPFKKHIVKSVKVSADPYYDDNLKEDVYRIDVTTQCHIPSDEFSTYCLINKDERDDSISEFIELLFSGTQKDRLNICPHCDPLKNLQK